MGIELRLPNLNAQTEGELLSQIRSYLYQFVPQLQWALSSLESSSTGAVAQTSGATPTQRTIAPRVSSAQDSEATFNAIKSLIIKSADIVNAYYEEINSRLDGAYVAESDFGTYTEQTAQQITETSTRIDRVFSDIDTIESDIEGIGGYISNTQAHVTIGKLYEGDDGIDVFGIEIGQINEVNGEEKFNKYARFTSDRLSFYDKNNTEVAYISDYKLNITNAEITDTLTLGGYVIETSNGLALKWVGRG
jgi:hypothetical protein